MLTKLRVGTPNQLLEDHYMDYCEHAFTEFCELHWPCNFQKKEVRCVNVFSGHAKGHQNAAGKILAAGNYVPSFHYNNDLCRWIQRIEKDLISIQTSKDDASPGFNVEEIMSALHVENMKTFYKEMGFIHRFSSHYTCFCCLRELPIHPLGCGHVLCSACVRSYGEAKGTGLVEMHRCPICQAQDLPLTPCLVKFMPPLAGVRVLCLDG